MNLTAELHGGPLDGREVDIGSESVPYELNLQDNVAFDFGSLEVRVPDSPVFVYRRRGGLAGIGVGEPTAYYFVGPAKRGSRR